MKHSRQQAAPSQPAMQTVMQLVDDEMAKIVANIAAGRPARPPGKPRRSRSGTVRGHAKAAA